MQNNSPRRKLIAGQPLDGLSASMWNELVRKHGQAKDDGQKAPKQTSTQILIKNTTGSALATSFKVVEVAVPIITYAANADEFFRTRQLKGTTPSTTSKTIAIVQEALSADAIGTATLLGLTPCKVDVTNIAHNYAGPIASTANLTSGTSGHAKILWVESDDPGPRTTGEQWGLVLLTGSAGTGGTRGIRFTLPGALASTDASIAACTVDDYWSNPDPGATVTVYNPPASSNYMFSGLTGSKGIALYDEIDSKWWIIQLQCSGGGSGSTIAIGSTDVIGGDTNGLIYTDGTDAQTAPGTRIESGNLELFLGTDRWLAFSVGSY